MSTATMTTTDPRPKPVSEHDVLLAAAEALRAHEQLRAALRASENRLRTLCRLYGDQARVWGVAPHHLAQACRARGLL